MAYYAPSGQCQHTVLNFFLTWNLAGQAIEEKCHRHPTSRERERELRREGGKSLLAYVEGVHRHPTSIYTA